LSNEPVGTKNNFFVFGMYLFNDSFSLSLFFNDFLFYRLKNKQTNVWIKTKTFESKLKLLKLNGLKMNENRSRWIKKKFSMLICNWSL